MYLQEHSRKIVAYYYDDSMGTLTYGPHHVMKPHRIKMAHHLVFNYGLYEHMQIYRPMPANFEELTQFHSQSYIEFLQNTKPKDVNKKKLSKVIQENLNRFNFNEDCPVFEGMFELAQMSCGGSIAAARKLGRKEADIAINWMGGLHHAKHQEASGFCYTNDIVLGILELRKYYQRVLYVDIDVHHGDGVEQAFKQSDHVMTVSFHKYEVTPDYGFFPCTGDVSEIGAGPGKGYAVNVPLKDGITDESYQSIFKPIIRKVMEVFQPNVVVLQCGADSLVGDRLGSFNMTLKGHGECVKFFRHYDIPLMLLGGGGYVPVNVARCWTYETGIAANRELPNELPYNDYFEYYGPDYCLHLDPSPDDPDYNTPEDLQKILEKITENLRNVTAAPGNQLRVLDESSEIELPSLDDEINHDVRLPQAITDVMLAHPAEFYDEKEGNGSHTPPHKRRSIMDSVRRKHVLRFTQ